MAKLVGGDPRQVRGVSLKNQYMVDVYRGTIRVRKWPKKRGKPKTQEHRDQVEKFSQANRLAKYANAGSQIAAMSATKNTSFYPRDLQVMAMYGRAWALAFPGERTLWPMAARADVSGSMDVLASGHGDLLGRGHDFWSPITPGPVGQILTSNGVGELPSFKAGGDFTGAKMYGDLQSGAASGTLFATKGWWFDCLIPIRIHGMVVTIAETLNETYIARVFSLSTFTIAAEISTSLTQTSTASGSNTRHFGFTTTPTLVPGTRYFFAFSRTDGADNSDPGIPTIATNPAPIPVNGPYGWGRITKKNPVALDVLSGNSNGFNPYPLKIIYEI